MREPEREIARRRLRSQRIACTEFCEPGAVVAWMGAMQGQDYAGAKWSVGLRAADVTDAGVERAIAERSIVRTWPLRGTLHFVAAADVRWMTALAAERVKSRSAGRWRQLGLGEAAFAKSLGVLARALEGGRQLTREELTEALKTGGIEASGERLSHILYRAGLERLVCFGVRRGAAFTYTLLDEWVPAAEEKTREESLAELARRYFTSRGPATLQDFVWWSGLTTADARIGLEAVKTDFEEAVVDGRSYWFSGGVVEAERSEPTLFLLPGLDEYVLGYTDRSAVLDERYTSRIARNGMLMSTIVVDGRVVGMWRRTLKKNGVLVEPEPFEALGEGEQRLFDAAAERYAAFLEVPRDHAVAAGAQRS